MTTTIEQWTQGGPHVLVTGVAGFIGSHLAIRLLRLGAKVRGFDNFATGHKSNLEAIANEAGAFKKNFVFMEGDIRQPEQCAEAVRDTSVVFHQAALGSVPRSIQEPRRTHESNVDGFFNMLSATQSAGIKRFVYASSSSIYGDEATLPKRETLMGRPLSPYAASKRINELYAESFFHSYGLAAVGLRYFNVFGARQDPNGPYAAVIPRWIDALKKGNTCEIFGDGSNSRDFCYIDNVVEANLLAAVADPGKVAGRGFNIAVGDRTTLTELYERLRAEVGKLKPAVLNLPCKYREERAGDVPHSLADISAAKLAMGYAPLVGVRDGIAKTVADYLK